jgi:hypothetical protein
MAFGSIAAPRLFADQESVGDASRRHEGLPRRLAASTQVPRWGPDFPGLISALTNQGIVYIYGALSEGDTPIPVLEMIRKMPTVKGYSIRR